MNFWPWSGRRSREERELDEELRFHLEQEAQLRMERGEDSESARRAASRDFGNFTLAREVTRSMWGGSMLERALQDVRFAARVLRKSPGFTAVAIAALALGIGATTAAFSVVHSVLLCPLAFPDPDRLVMIWERTPQGKLTNVVQTQNFLDWRERSHSFEGIAAIWPAPKRPSSWRKRIGRAGRSGGGFRSGELQMPTRRSQQCRAADGTQPLPYGWKDCRNTPT